MRSDGKCTNKPTLRRFRILEEQPYVALQLAFRHWLFGLLDEAFVFSEFEQSGLAELVEFDLLNKHIERNIDRPA